MYRISYRFLVPGWSAKPLVSAHDRIMGTHTRGQPKQRAASTSAPRNVVPNGAADNSANPNAKIGEGAVRGCFEF